MEKERNRASDMGYECVIQETKEDTDHDYNLAINSVLIIMKRFRFVVLHFTIRRTICC